MNEQLPVVLVLAGHDPTGGAGLTADGEAISACGGWAVTVPTALTVQDCHDVHRVVPVPANLIGDMARRLGEFRLAAIKVGLVASLETLDAVVDVVKAHPGVPVVVDPVLKAGGGKELSTTALVDAFRARLLPLVDILTPNRLELARLADPQAQDDSERARRLLSLGCRAVLVSGSDDPDVGVPGDEVELALYSAEGRFAWRWRRLEGSFHGSGCTLASALAARLAAGDPLQLACERAQRFAWQALAHAWQPGKAQSLPRRLAVTEGVHGAGQGVTLPPQ
ncbi:hydroxymethylpyrimidine/phosphomethylpyrimidine kinase [Billgrantia tianxiuensis]|uniref:hydroxymethylpyrimidine kinase n=1 Tax=Billgrantia tianxiuensis TaxID=2497861 RepID=A0A6I6SWN8_9GAMM|nr:hydroxymethylpyrimidine/phosphomethylpyrimidine kinase [Halomonas tianxiuensis]QHC51953.1 hydroxymethylpyrimidine/phosphomethylpyrimidine kinase [Halomonas tianxiuensis]